VWEARLKRHVKGKGKVLPYSFSSVRPRADPGAQAISPQVTLNYQLSGRLPLVSARQVTFAAEERHHPLASTKLYCLVTETHGCKQLAQGWLLDSAVAGAQWSRVRAPAAVLHWRANNTHTEGTHRPCYIKTCTGTDHKCALHAMQPNNECYIRDTIGFMADIDAVLKLKEEFSSTRSSRSRLSRCGSKVCQ